MHVYIPSCHKLPGLFWRAIDPLQKPSGTKPKENQKRCMQMSTVTLFKLILSECNSTDEPCGSEISENNPGLDGLSTEELSNARKHHDKCSCTCCTPGVEYSRYAQQTKKIIQQIFVKHECLPIRKAYRICVVLWTQLPR